MKQIGKIFDNHWYLGNQFMKIYYTILSTSVQVF